MTVEKAIKIVAKKYPNYIPIEYTEYKNLLVFTMREKGKDFGEFPEIDPLLVSVDRFGFARRFFAQKDLPGFMSSKTIKL